MARVSRGISAVRSVFVAAAIAAGPGLASPVLAAPGAAIHFGVVAEEPNEPGHMLGVYADLLARLRERLVPEDLPVGELVVARDIEDLSQRIARGEVDFVIETAFPTLVLQERSHRLAPALVVVRRGQREYHSVFFTRQDAPIQRLADLRGRTLVLQVLRSTSAFALPKAELARAGIALVSGDDPRAGRDNVRYVLAQAEINQAIWVLRGKGDAGAFNEGNWAALPERMRSQLRVFHETRPIVRGLLSFRTSLAASARRQVEEMLLTLDADEGGRAALDRAGGITRLERLTPADRRALQGWAPILRPDRAP
jgi:ABC-type phosphate/phosphonate transport system substrate-binding protein